MVGTAKHQQTLDARSGLGIRTTLDDAEAARDADIVLLAVKPQAMDEVLQAIRPFSRTDQLVISIAAGRPTGPIQSRP